MYSVFPTQPPAIPSEQTENTRPSTTAPTTVPTTVPTTAPITVPTDILGDEEDVTQEQQIAKAVLKIIECVGEDPSREGLRDTPERYAKAMLWFTKGYTQSVESILNGAIFNEESHDLVIVKDIDISSLCEHHLIPFTGKMHIGYYPKGRIVGLSKLARVAEMFSRRFQVQERLTKQVANAIFDVLKPNGVAVILESSHLCMSMRGVQKVESTTTTRCVLGCMQSTHRWNEFVALLNRE